MLSNNITKSPPLHSKFSKIESSEMQGAFFYEINEMESKGWYREGFLGRAGWSSFFPLGSLLLTLSLWVPVLSLAHV